jgi:diacylglycerol kinase
VSAAERAMLFGSVLLVLLVELLNSSVEAAVDRIGFDTHRLSKRAKDLGSAAVFIALVMLATTWGLIAIPPLIQFGQGLFSSPHKAATADVDSGSDRNTRVTNQA